jgi:hypothetical protein
MRRMSLLIIRRHEPRRRAMYSLIYSVGLRRGLVREGPALLLSMIVAEVFYRFHSFTLECLAFLATWFAVSYAFSRARAAWAREPVS